jgi:DNA-binding NtrC family response regulator
MKHILKLSSFDVPVREKISMRPSSAIPDGTDASARGNPRQGRILLVDTDTEVRASMAYALESEGYPVRAAATAEEALAYVDAEIDVVLLDLGLPDASGWDLFEGIKALHPSLPIVVTTTRSDQYQSASRAGATALMEKPLYLPRLIETLDRLLHESRLQRVRRMVQGEPLLLKRNQAVH